MVPLYVMLWVCFALVCVIGVLGIWIWILKGEQRDLESLRKECATLREKRYEDSKTLLEMKKAAFLLMVECRRRWAVNNYIFRKNGLDPAKMRGQRFVRVLPHGNVYHNYMMCHPHIEAESMLLYEAEKMGYRECMRCSFCGFDYPNMPDDFKISFIECRDWLIAGNGDNLEIEKAMFEKITNIKVG